MIRLEFSNNSFRWWNPLTWWNTGYYVCLEGIETPIKVACRGKKLYIFVDSDQELTVMKALTPHLVCESGHNYNIGRTVM